MTGQDVTVHDTKVLRAQDPFQSHPAPMGARMPESSAASSGSPVQAGLLPYCLAEHVFHQGT